MKIVTHYQPGLDEITAIWLLRRHMHIDIADVFEPVTFMKKGDYEHPHMSEVMGVLYVGCGLGSWANEHYLQDTMTSSAKLVAEKLNVYSRYRLLIDEVTREDRYGSGGVKYHIGQAIKDLYDMGMSFHDLYMWVTKALSALVHSTWRPKVFSMDKESITYAISRVYSYKDARQWLAIFEDTQKWGKGEFIKCCAYLDKNPYLFREVETYRGVVKAFVSDTIQTNKRITHAARSKGAQIVMCQNLLDFGQTGTLIEQAQSAHISFLNVLEELRKHELCRKGEANASKMASCKGEGTLSVCSVWHGHQSACGQTTCFGIYNRSKTRPKSMGTVLSWDYIVDLTLETLKTTPTGEVIKGMNSLKLQGK